AGDSGGDGSIIALAVAVDIEERVTGFQRIVDDSIRNVCEWGRIVLAIAERAIEVHPQAGRQVCRHALLDDLRRESVEGGLTCRTRGNGQIVRRVAAGNAVALDAVTEH